MGVIVVVVAAALTSVIRGGGGGAALVAVMAISVDQIMDVDEFLHMTWKCDCSFVIKPVFLLSLL